MSNYYVPILKWKRGEQKALELTSNTTKDKLLPLIEIPPIDYDWNNDVLKKTIDEHLSDFCDQVNSSFGTRKAFVDLCWVEDFTQMKNGLHPIEQLIDEANSRGLQLIPTVGVNRSIDYLNAVSKLLAAGKISEACIRIETEDFNNLNNLLNSLLTQLNRTANSCHLIIDLKEITSSNISLLQTVLPVIVNNTVSLSSWISITLAGTGFPENLSAVAASSYSSIPRTEFTLWHSLRTTAALNRNMQYGDYCIAHPLIADIDPRLMNMSGNLRYTTSNNFIIYKGTNVRKNGFSQMRVLCQHLVNSTYFCGKNLSWGDSYIEDCSNGNSSTGNAETWRRVGTNHHLEFIVSQFSSFSYF
jgi:hypothetical protein